MRIVGTLLLSILIVVLGIALAFGIFGYFFPGAFYRDPKPTAPESAASPAIHGTAPARAQIILRKLEVARNPPPVKNPWADEVRGVPAGESDLCRAKLKLDELHQVLASKEDMRALLSAGHVEFRPELRKLTVAWNTSAMVWIKSVSVERLVCEERDPLGKKMGQTQLQVLVEMRSRMMALEILPEEVKSSALEMRSYIQRAFMRELYKPDGYFVWHLERVYSKDEEKKRRAAARPGNMEEIVRFMREYNFSLEDLQVTLPDEDPLIRALKAETEVKTPPDSDAASGSGPVVMPTPPPGLMPSPRPSPSP